LWASDHFIGDKAAGRGIDLPSHLAPRLSMHRAINLLPFVLPVARYEMTFTFVIIILGLYTKQLPELLRAV
jgi:hypothetical protein